VRTGLAEPTGAVAVEALVTWRPPAAEAASRAAMIRLVRVWVVMLRLLM